MKVRIEKEIEVKVWVGPTSRSPLLEEFAPIILKALERVEVNVLPILAAATLERMSPKQREHFLNGRCVESACARTATKDAEELALARRVLRQAAETTRDGVPLPQALEELLQRHYEQRQELQAVRLELERTRSSLDALVAEKGSVRQ